MVMPFDPTASIPLALLTVSSETMDETELYDVAYFDLRNRLQGISGVIAPAVYGGKLRLILAYVDREKLQARNLSPMDVVDALNRFNLMIPTGNAKFGALDYQIDANSMVDRVEELNDFPVKIENNGARPAPVYLRDVARAEDAAQIQTNIVRVDGKRQVYIPIHRQSNTRNLGRYFHRQDDFKCHLALGSRRPDGHSILQLGNAGRVEQVFDRESGLELEFRSAEESALVLLLRRQRGKAERTDDETDRRFRPEFPHERPFKMRSRLTLRILAMSHNLRFPENSFGLFDKLWKGFCGRRQGRNGPSRKLL